MDREGRYFEFGYPHFKRGLTFQFPDMSLDYPGLLMERQDELKPHLLDRMKGYFEEFGIRSPSMYPYLDTSRRAIGLHIGTDQKSVTLAPEAMNPFLSEHNLDGWGNMRAAGVNVAADALEYLDPSILAPRISIENGVYVMRYPLPNGIDMIGHENFGPPAFDALYQSAGLDRAINYTPGSTQVIENSQGVIKIKDGMCEGRWANEIHASNASWVMSILMTLSNGE